jgi:hypothetical protein
MSQYPVFTNTLRVTINNIQEEITIDTFLKYLEQPDIFKFSLATFTLTGEWMSQSVFAIESNNSLPAETMLERLAVFNIVPNIVSYSRNSSDEIINCRVFFLLDKVISKPEHRDLVNTALATMFPECDLKHNDQVRLNTTVTVLNYIPTESNHLIESGFITMITKDKNQTRKIAEKRTQLLDYYSKAQNSAEQKIPTYSIPKVTKPDLFRPSRSKKYNFSLGAEQVRIFREFLDGMCLNHIQLFGLATNLLWIKGGLKLMKETMEKHNREGKTKYSQHNYNVLIYVRCLDLIPQQLKSYSPYPEDGRYIDLSCAAITTKGYINNTKSTIKVSLTEAEDMFKTEMERVVKTESNKIYLFRVPTGLGKTTLISRLKKVKIAFPTHKLKEEVFEKTGKECGVIISPELPKFSGNINVEIQKYYQMGLYDKVLEIFEKLALKDNENGEMAVRYLKEDKLSRNAESTIYTTHEKAMLTDCLQDTLIFDEDPIRSFVNIGHTIGGDLFNLTKYDNGIRDFHSTIDALEDDKVHQIPPKEIDKWELKNHITKADVNTNITGFLDSDYFIKYKQKIVYATVRKFPENRKVIILSATPLVDFYKEIYGERVEVIDVEDVKNQCTVSQYTDKSYSRSSTKKADIKALKAKHPQSHCITFMKYSEKRSIHFGNCSGYDDYKGQDLLVIGTPHIHPFVYLLYAKVMGLSWTDQGMQNKRVKWRGFEFYMMCYNDPMLRNIQFSCIEAELIQAVGRARTIRTEAKVIVYSNFPIRIADEFRSEAVEI